MSDKAKTYVTYEPGELTARSVHSTLADAEARAERESTSDTTLHAMEGEEWREQAKAEAIRDTALEMISANDYTEIMDTIIRPVEEQHKGVTFFMPYISYALGIAEQVAKTEDKDGKMIYATRLMDIRDKSTWITREEMRDAA